MIEELESDYFYTLIGVIVIILAFLIPGIILVIKKNKKGLISNNEG